MNITKEQQKTLLRNRINELEKRRGTLSYGEVITLKRLYKELEGL